MASNFLQDILDWLKGNNRGGNTPLASFSTRSLKLSGKQLFYGLTAYRWSTMSKKDRWYLIDTLVKNNWTGVEFELMEMLADWPHGQTVEDILKALKEKVDRLAEDWLPDLQAAGLWCYCVDNNSNADVNKKIKTPGILFDLNDYIVKRCGKFTNLIRLPISEDDSDLFGDGRDKTVAIPYIARVEATWPDERTSAMSHSRSKARFTEHHQGHIKDKAPGGGWTHIAVSDTGHILDELCGGSRGTIMDSVKARQWVGSMLDAGNSVSLYALHTWIDDKLIVEVGKVGKQKGV